MSELEELQEINHALNCINQNLMTLIQDQQQFYLLLENIGATVEHNRSEKINE